MSQHTTPPAHHPVSARALSTQPPALATGPNGAGKSSLLRTLLRLWPAAEGEVLLAPSRAEIGVLPQRAYVPPTASLGAFLLYPRAAAGAAPSTAEMLEMLRWGGLAHLAADEAALLAPGGCAALSGAHA